jgi:hypothetical protein
MNTFVVTILYVLIWRLCVLGCGLVSIVLGYRLFKSGFASEEGSIEAGVGGNSMKLSKVAPGTFFALFGSAIIATLIWTSPPEIVIPKDAMDTGKVDMNGQGIHVRSGK